jgi:hypothetical protein
VRLPTASYPYSKPEITSPVDLKLTTLVVHPAALYTSVARVPLASFRTLCRPTLSYANVLRSAWGFTSSVNRRAAS